VKYRVTVEGTEHEVEVIGDEVRLNGRVLSAHLASVPRSPLRQLVLNGGARTYAMVSGDEGWVVLLSGHILPVSVEDERTRKLRSLTGADDAHDHGGVVKAPMPGLVLRVEVEVGQRIDQGTGVVVLEAMKMENEIRAGSGGVVCDIRVEPGQAVDKGAVLIELAPLQG
jgi:pyruvate carboxylase subunit B